VQDIACTLKSSEDALAARVSELELVLREWNEVFAAPSRALQAAGVTPAANTPRALAATVLSLSAALRGAETDALTARSALEREAMDLRMALRDAGRVAREQAAHELGALRARAEGALAGERAARAAAEAELAETRAGVAAEIRRGVAEEVRAATRGLRGEVARLQAEAAAAVGAAERARDAAEARAAALETEAAAAARGLATVRRDAALATAALKEEASGAAAALEAARGAHARELREAEDSWRSQWAAGNAEWERSTGAERTAALEAQTAALAGRVAELSALCAAMQGALAASSGSGGGGGGGAGGGQRGGVAQEATVRSRAAVPAAVAGAPWRARAFGDAPVLVRHGSLSAGARPPPAGNTPVATAYLQA
jgi:hypothetical protein